MPTIDFALQFVTLFALVAGIFFGILEVRRAAKARAEKAALDVFEGTGQREVMDAMTLVMHLPVDAEPAAVSSHPEVHSATELLLNLFEYWGVMVFYRVVPLRTLDLIVGGVVRGAWQRLHRYIQWERQQTMNDVHAEWFQWLVERLTEYPQPEKRQGAHVAFADWRP